MLGPEEDTLQTCPCCHGSGWQEKSGEREDGHYYAIRNECFLCGGRGAIAAGVLAMWHDAGRPQVRTQE